MCVPCRTATVPSMVRCYECPVSHSDPPAIGMSDAPQAHEPGPAIGKIERVPLRTVWKHEAHDLTMWLEENPDVLNDALGLSLTSVDREQSVGAFSVDLLGEDAEGRTVVIENQLERSDHDHLGKLITYAAFFEARIAVWIVADPRPEHVQAITWLNESAPTDFYLAKLEGIRIANSPPAPLLTLIVGPSAEGREVGEVKKDRAERHELRHRFWEQFLELSRTRTRLFSGLSPTDQNWIGTGAGVGGLEFNVSVRQHDSQAELYIDRGTDRGAENTRIFEQLLAERDAIEETFGGPLEWQALPERRACRIRAVSTTGGYRDEERWPEIQAEMVEASIRLERALKPHISQLVR